MTELRILGKNGLKVSCIGLDCLAIGGPALNDDGLPNGRAGNDDHESNSGLIKHRDGY